MAVTLADAIANAVLFAGDAKTDSGGRVKIRIHNLENVTLESYDDYLYIQQSVDITHGISSHEFWIDKKTLKDEGEDGFWQLKDSPETGPDEIFETLSQLLWQFPEALLGKFIFPSDRFSKLSRIKGEDPMTVTLGEDQGMTFAKFKKGEVLGLMSFLEFDNE